MGEYAEGLTTLKPPGKYKKTALVSESCFSYQIG